MPAWVASPKYRKGKLPMPGRITNPGKAAEYAAMLGIQVTPATEEMLSIVDY